MSAPRPEPAPRVRWLSKPFSELVNRLQDSAGNRTPEIFDVVIIGSGYGGSIAAEALAGCQHNASGVPLSVCVLERGKEYLPGMFPSRMSELPTHLRFSMPGSDGEVRAREALFDLKLGSHVSAIVANGLGGGSLINAGVMEVPKPQVFDERWPASLQDRAALLPLYTEAKRLLGARYQGQDNNITLHPKVATQSLKKRDAFQALAQGQHFRDAALTIAMHDKCNDAGVTLHACKLCGDCATGCNYGAKESLDCNLLVAAAARGVEIYTGATVLELYRHAEEDCWVLSSTYTNKALSQRHGDVIPILARKVILAAGALGSTEILLRSQKNHPELKLSQQLGRQFSTNGDMIAAGYAQKQEVNAVADETQPPADRHIGPSITSIIDRPAAERCFGSQPELVLEELAIPGPLRTLFEESYTTAATLDWLSQSDNSRHQHEHPLLDPYAVKPSDISHTQIYAAMGDDGAGGEIRLRTQKHKTLGDGAIEIIWPEINQQSLFTEQINTFRGLAKTAGLGGITIGNPLWQILPDSMRFLVNNERGPLLTVHPLGGCAMADHADQGVVNDIGQVFHAASDRVYPELVVLDGAILPCALATNPALTIATLALRAIRTLKQEWQLEQAPAQPNSSQRTRPIYRDAEQEIINRPAAAATVGEFTERLNGPLRLAFDKRALVAELTLYYQTKPLAELLSTDQQGRLQSPVLQLSRDDAQRCSRIRIFEAAAWQTLQSENCTTEKREQLLADAALFIAPLSGSLTLMRRQASTPCQRRRQGLSAWLRNRALRDFWQYTAKALQDFLQPQPAQRRSDNFLVSGFKRVYGAWKLASHAGEARLFEYELEIAEPGFVADDFSWPSDGQARLRGCKTITYQRPSNPWRQLMEMQILEMPGLQKSPSEAFVLTLDNRYMASQGAPLFRIVDQQDQFTALVELISLVAYIARMLFSIHIWNARLPEPPRLKPNRLPGKVPGLPAPEISWIRVDTVDGVEIRIRLAHYPATAQNAQPVAMFHGYSASGTTFAHPAPPMDIARYLHQRGRDVWVVDLRSSCGLDTARLPWSFETIGLKDIPVAIDHIYHACGGSKIDVIAHCMGSVMFSMAVLSANKAAQEVITDWDEGFEDNFQPQRQALPSRIRRVVLSQVGPLVVFSPRNVFSGYVTNYLRYFLPLDNYQFRPSQNPGLAEQLMDRLLATLPYPDDELLLENPAWPPWRRTRHIGTRHRMDALYGRDFKLANLNQQTLKYIDDFFGPLNTDTVSQVIHFARLQMITNRYGRNRFISQESLRSNWLFPTMSIHGEENGLSDIATLERMRSEMQQADRDFTATRIKGYGHQDCWIGEHAARDVFPLISAFLDQAPSAHIQNHSQRPLLACAPWSGPVLGLSASDLQEGKQIPVAVGASPSLGMPPCVVLLPVAQCPQDKHHKQGKPIWHAVYQGRILSADTPIPAAAMQIVGIDTPEGDWMRVKLDPVLFSPPAQAVMLLTIHDQSPTLESRSFDENF